jgi:hypothetical protein
MPGSFLTFRCASCEASLEVHESVDRLRCGVCGGKMLPRRAAAAEPGAAEPIGWNPARRGEISAEVAIRRYENEIQELRASEVAIGSKHFAPVRGAFVGGSCALLAGAAVVAAALMHTDGFANDGPLGFVLALLGGYVLLFAYRNSIRDSAELRELREHIAELERLIDQHKQTARADAEG